MPYDFKTEYKEYYQARKSPQILFIPTFRYIVLDGSGKPGKDNASFTRSLEEMEKTVQILRQSMKLGHEVPLFQDYVTPPVETLSRNSGRWTWRLVSRIPDFFQAQDLEWAAEEAGKKLGRIIEGIRMESISEGMCAQIMHTGSASSKAESWKTVEDYIQGYGYSIDSERYQHEIPLSDPARCARNKMRTVLRLPVK